MKLKIFFVLFGVMAVKAMYITPEMDCSGSGESVKFKQLFEAKFDALMKHHESVDLEIDSTGEASMELDPLKFREVMDDLNTELTLHAAQMLLELIETSCKEDYIKFNEDPCEIIKYLEGYIDEIDIDECILDKLIFLHDYVQEVIDDIDASTDWWVEYHSPDFCAGEYYEVEASTKKRKGPNDYP